MDQAPKGMGLTHSNLHNEILEPQPIELMEQTQESIGLTHSNPHKKTVSEQSPFLLIHPQSTA